ncbi:MAG: hypothetical protein HOK80_09285 [Candidatus Cloacimonetes bacterium]|jgi:hypothetical protein|nr:hypothetical protein [Candidatus Cloacimonadota bacterium]
MLKKISSYVLLFALAAPVLATLKDVGPEINIFENFKNNTKYVVEEPGYRPDKQNLWFSFEGQDLYAVEANNNSIEVDTIKGRTASFYIDYYAPPKEGEYDPVRYHQCEFSIATTDDSKIIIKQLVLGGEYFSCAFTGDPNDQTGAFVITPK